MSIYDEAKELRERLQNEAGICSEKNMEIKRKEIQQIEQLMPEIVEAVKNEVVYFLAGGTEEKQHEIPSLAINGTNTYLQSRGKIGDIPIYMDMDSGRRSRYTGYKKVLRVRTVIYSSDFGSKEIDDEKNSFSDMLTFNPEIYPQIKAAIETRDINVLKIEHDDFLCGMQIITEVDVEEESVSHI